MDQSPAASGTINTIAASTQEGHTVRPAFPSSVVRLSGPVLGFARLSVPVRVTVVSPPHSRIGVEEALISGQFALPSLRHHR